LALFAFIVMALSVEAADPDVNITLIDGAGVGDLNKYFSYAQDGNLTITFTVIDTDQDDLNFNMWSGATKSAKTTVIIEDFNLSANTLADGGSTFPASCDSNNSSSTLTCTMDWNISSALVSDGNYFLTIDINAGTAGGGWAVDSNSFDISLAADNTAPVTISTDYNWSAQNDDANITLSCSDTTAGCDITQFRLDTDRTSSTSFGAWTTYDTNIFVTGDGNWAVDFNSSDLAGNLEDTNTIYVVINYAPDINITKIDGTDVNTAQMPYSYTEDANLTITFNVSDLAQNDLNFNMWYSSSAGSRTNIIVEDLNLTDTAGQGACASTDWTATVTCTYDFNISATLVSSDGNYFIDVVLNDGLSTDTNSSDSNFMIDNTAPVTISTDINYTAQATDANVTFSCTDSNSGCSLTQFRLDTDGTDTVSFGAWTTYDSNIFINTDGNWAIDINSTDNVGNMEDSNRLYVLIDSSIPIVTISAPEAGQIHGTTTTQVTVSYTSSQAIDKYWVREGNSGLYTDNTTLTDYNVTTAPGNIYEIYVIATDSTDSNSQPAVIRFEVSSAGGDIVPVCGNSICEIGEDLSSCPQDCGPICGDGQCTSTESIINCPKDCAIGCGNKICEENESCSDCSIDCGICPIDISNTEIILQKTIIQQPSLDIISKLLMGLGKPFSSIDQTIENHKKINVEREITVRKMVGTNKISSTLSIILKNITDTELRNVKVIESIPKSIAASSDEIQTSYFFAVLEEDPIIQFIIPSIQPGGTAKFSYIIDKEVAESQFGEFIPPIAISLTEFFPGLTCGDFDCDDNNPCTTDRCFDAECSYIALEDETSCGFGKQCLAGTCRNITTDYVDSSNDFLLSIVVIIIAIGAGGFYLYIKRSSQKMQQSKGNL